MRAAHAHSVSVLICTYNRAALLAETLAALNVAQAPDDCVVEIVVVDNNSSDDTRAVVEQAASQSRWPIRYALESQQGKSYALNRGLALASGDILALTDDDVIPDEQWLVRIVGQFRTRDVVFVFGKVLPRWEIAPPPEMLTTSARDIWGPLALIDYGDELLSYDAATFGTRRLPIGANLAIRRSAIEQVGAWRTDLGKVDNSLIAGEDHELCVRLFQAGLYDGVYDPAVVVQHFVPRSRLRRGYFRRWFYWHGRTMARMSDAIFHEIDLRRVPHVAGVPRFVYREFLTQVGRWMRCVGRADALALLKEEVQLIDYVGFFREAWFGRGGRDRRTPVSAPENLPASS
jgi:glycosyltransferase involved in cell wall biosynthesis